MQETQYICQTTNSPEIFMLPFSLSPTGEKFGFFCTRELLNFVYLPTSDGSIQCSSELKSVVNDVKAMIAKRLKAP